MVLEFCYRRISAVKQLIMQAVTRQPINKIFFFSEFSRVSPGAHPLTKKPEDSEYKIECRQFSHYAREIIGFVNN